MFKKLKKIAAGVALFGALSAGTAMANKLPEVYTPTTGSSIEIIQDKNNMHNIYANQIALYEFRANVNGDIKSLYLMSSKAGSFPKIDMVTLDSSNPSQYYSGGFSMLQLPERLINEFNFSSKDAQEFSSQIASDIYKVTGVTPYNQGKTGFRIYNKITGKEHSISVHTNDGNKVYIDGELVSGDAINIFKQIGLDKIDDYHINSLLKEIEKREEIKENIKNYNPYNDSYENRKPHMVDVLHEALSRDLNPDAFFKKLGSELKSESIINKRLFMKDIYETLYVSYDKKVMSGHSYEITEKEIIENLKYNLTNENVKFLGNCGDFATFTYKLGKTSFGWRGTIVSSGTHLFPIFLDESGNFYSPENNSIIDNDFYSYIKKIRMATTRGPKNVGISHFFFDDKEFLGYIQDFLQQRIEKNTMPFGVTHLLDLKKIKIPVNDSGIFVVGDDQLKLIGLKKSYKSNYDLSVIEGEFGISGNLLFGEDSTIRGKISSQSPYLNLSLFNNLDKNFELKVLEDAKITLGNFTKMAINWSFEKSGYGSSSEYFFPSEIKAESSIYALTSFKDKLYLLSSIGIVPNIKKPSDQSITADMKYELGLMYVGDGFDLSLVNENIAKMNRASLKINKGIGKTPFEISYEAINTRFNNEDLKKMIPELQQRLAVAFNNKSGTKISFGVTKEGKDTVVSFDAKIPFGVITDLTKNLF